MQTILLTVHILLAVSITILVMLQRAEGGALGALGGGQGGAGFLTGRQAGNLLTKLTGCFFFFFIYTSLSLVILARQATVNETVSLLPTTEQTTN